MYTKSIAWPEAAPPNVDQLTRREIRMKIIRFNLFNNFQKIKKVLKIKYQY